MEWGSLSKILIKFNPNAICIYIFFKATERGGTYKSLYKLTDTFIHVTETTVTIP